MHSYKYIGQNNILYMHRSSSAVEIDANFVIGLAYSEEDYFFQY